MNTIRRFIGLAVLVLTFTIGAAVGSTGSDIRNIANAQAGLVVGQSYSIVVPAGDRPQCRDVSDDGLRTPLSAWTACPHPTSWYPRDKFTATYIGESQGEHLFQTPWGRRWVFDRFIR